MPTLPSARTRNASLKSLKAGAQTGAPTKNGERALISALQEQALQTGGTPRQLRTGIGDDCAILRVPRGHELAVTTDLLLETTHFRRDWHSPESAGHRCLARGLSDLAATGARPLAVFLSVAVPSELAGPWLTRFLAGLLALAKAAKVPLAGGDTAQAPAIRNASLFTADIVLLGSLSAGTALLRSGARAGDLLYVTGALGGAAAQLATLKQNPAASLRKRKSTQGDPQLFPQPRLAQGARLRGLATAAIDLSDGLSTDLAHLCESSDLHAEIEAAAIPIHALARSQSALALPLAIHGGEDYELLFTAAPGTRIPRTIAGVPVTKIGRMLRTRKRSPLVTLIGTDGSRAPLENEGWEHFNTRSGS